MSDAQFKIDDLLAQIKSGKTLYICTALTATKIDQRIVEKFEKAGRQVLKASGGSMWLSSGRKYVCIDFCGFRYASN